MLATHTSRSINTFLVVALLLCLSCLQIAVLSQTRQGEITNNSTSGQEGRPASQQEAETEAERLDKQIGELQDQGKTDEAVLLLARSLMLNETELGLEPFKVAVVLKAAGAIYQRRDDYVLAERCFRRSLEIRQQVLRPTHPDIAESLNWLGRLYQEEDDYVRAGPMLEQALEILEKEFGSNDLRVASSLNNLAFIYMWRGDNLGALRMLQQALKIHERVYNPNHPEVANSLNNLGALYLHMEDLERAEPLLERALKIQEKVFGANSFEAAVTLTTLASLYQGNYEFARAEPLLLRAVDIMEKLGGPDNPNIAHPLASLAWIYKARGEYERAGEMQRRALDVQVKALGLEHPMIAVFLSELAQLYEAQGDIPRAISTQIRASDVRERNLSRMLSIGSEQQKRLYVESLLHYINVTISLHLHSAPTNSEAARLALTTILQRKGRSLDAMSDQVGALRRRLNAQDRALFDELSSKRAQLAALTFNGEAQANSNSRRELLSGLEAEAEQLEAQISARSAEYRTQSEPVTVEHVQQAIPADAVLLEFIAYRPFNVKTGNRAELWGPERYAVYLLRRTGEPAFVELGEAMPINAAAARLRTALSRPQSRDVKQAARELDELVMRPVRKLLGDERLILLSPDGVLNLVPFSALVDEQGRYLVESYSINYLISGRDLLRFEAQSESREPAVVFANPAFDRAVTTRSQATESTSFVSGRRSIDFKTSKYDPLPGTAVEAGAIKTIMPTAHVFTESQATEAALKQVSAPRILHVATHGFFISDLKQQEVARARRLEHDDALRVTRGENPLLRSGLVLAGAKKGQSGAGEDGVLTALEAAGLDLWGTKLVVLSACDTGVGQVTNGEGVSGLRRALVLAGSETQVMSLWKVSDAGTRDLMVAYYTRLQQGEGRTEALRQVQLAMLQGRLLSSSGITSSKEKSKRETGEASAKDYRHPYYWASFIPSGDWRNLAGQEK